MRSSGYYGGQSPLHHVICSSQNEEIVSILLTHGTDPNLQDSRGKTALHHAIEQNASLSIIELLLKHHANPDIIDESGVSPLLLEFKKHFSSHPPENITTIFLLLNAIKDPVRLKANKQRILTSIIKAGLYKLLEKYIADRYSIDIEDEEDRSPLQLAIISEIEDCNRTVALLLANKANVNATNKKGETALHTAVKNNCPTILNLLLEEKNHPNANAKDHQGLTPLHHALKLKITPDTHLIINTLLKKGAEINATDQEGNTVLHFLAQALSKQEARETKQCFFSLIEAGADPLTKNDKGDTPLTILIRKGSNFQWEDEKTPIEWQLAPLLRAKQLSHFSIVDKNKDKKEVILSFSGKPNDIDQTIRSFKNVFTILNKNKSLVTRIDDKANKYSQCFITLGMGILHNETFVSKKLTRALTKKDDPSTLKPLSEQEFSIWENNIKQFFFNQSNVTISPYAEGATQLTFKINPFLANKMAEITDAFLEKEIISRLKKSLDKKNLAAVSYNKETKEISVTPHINLLEKDESVLQVALKSDWSMLSGQHTPKQSVIPEENMPEEPPTSSVNNIDEVETASQHDQRTTILGMLTDITGMASETNLQFLNLVVNKKNKLILSATHAIPSIKTKEGSGIFIMPSIFFKALASVINDIQPNTIQALWNEETQIIQFIINKKALEKVSKSIKKDATIYQEHFKLNITEFNGIDSRVESFRSFPTPDPEKIQTKTPVTEKNTVELEKYETFSLTSPELANLHYHLDKLLDHPDFSILKTEEQKEIYYLNYIMHLNCVCMILGEANKKSIFLPLRDTLRHFQLQVDKAYTFLHPALNEIKTAETHEKSPIEKVGFLFTLSTEQTKQSQHTSITIKQTTLESLQKLFDEFKNPYKPLVKEKYKNILKNIMENPATHKAFNYRAAAMMAASLAGEMEKTPLYGVTYQVFGHEGYTEAHYETWVDEQFQRIKEQYQQLTTEENAIKSRRPSC